MKSGVRVKSDTGLQSSTKTLTDNYRVSLLNRWLFIDRIMLKMFYNEKVNEKELTIRI